jgi:hypothetical protein
MENKETMVIDETQKAINLFPAIKQIVDKVIRQGSFIDRLCRYSSFPESLFERA